MRRKDGRSASSGLRCPRVVLAKCPANRDRDWDFARAALAAGIVDGDELIRRAQLLPLEAELLIVVRTTLAGMLAQCGGKSRDTVRDTKLGETQLT
jgi:hypothetical protein